MTSTSIFTLGKLSSDFKEWNFVLTFIYLSENIPNHIPELGRDNRGGGYQSWNSQEKWNNLNCETLWEDNNDDATLKMVLVSSNSIHPGEKVKIILENQPLLILRNIVELWVISTTLWRHSAHFTRMASLSLRIW